VLEILGNDNAVTLECLFARGIIAASSGRSAAVAYLLWEQMVAGSIPAAPTSAFRAPDVAFCDVSSVSFSSGKVKPRLLLAVSACLGLITVVQASDSPQGSSFRSAFEARFPKTETSAAALEIERLAALLGIEMAPFESPEAPADERNSREARPPAPFTLKPRKERPGPFPERERSLLSAGVSEFLNRELGIPDDRIGPPPAQLDRFLADNESGIGAIESLLLREPEIRWEVDVTHYPNGPLPNLTELMRLQRLLPVDRR
jgi:hypothetical protein